MIIFQSQQITTQKWCTCCIELAWQRLAEKSCQFQQFESRAFEGRSRVGKAQCVMVLIMWAKGTTSNCIPAGCRLGPFGSCADATCGPGPAGKRAPAPPQQYCARSRLLDMHMPDIWIEKVGFKVMVMNCIRCTCAGSTGLIKCVYQLLSNGARAWTFAAT